ncbi:acetylornithine aminotransferase [Kocuria palustris]|nr:acetylornithine aminotransferase [Kocuria palustris]
MPIWIDAMFMRGGTSKGLFFCEQDLPPAGPQRDRVFTGALGSPDPFGRQLDGMGGGISSLSKVVSVAPSSRPDADVDYTFGQVAVREAVVDYSGNCGNLSAAVVPFALLAGIHEVDDDGPASVIAHNTNTGKLIEVRLEVADGVAVTSGDFVLPGVAGSGAPIELRYLDPSGSRTSGVLPTGRSVDRLDVGDREIEVSLVDVATPMVFVAAADLGLTGTELPDALDADADLAALMERIRRAGAVAMGLCETSEDAPQSVPKIAMVAPPAESTLLDGTDVPAADCDVLIRAVSMGLSHRAIPGTSAMCAAAAANIDDTVVQRCAASSGSELRIATPSGVVAAAADVCVEDGAPSVAAASLFRTARPLMRGQVALSR